MPLSFESKPSNTNMLANWYLQQTKISNLVFDSAQLAILQQLDNFITSFSQFNFFFSLFHKPKKLGYYIYGSVGRGKTMILDAFYNFFPETKKTRLHFHEFMSDIHQQLAHLKAHDEPLQIIAKNIKKSYKIIFLDEMHVSDIATAMILQNLLTSLFAEGIYIVTSSNFQPNELYLDGLLRDRFLPAIELMQQKLILLSLDTPNDYRLLNHDLGNVFLIGEASTAHLNQIFTEVNKDNPVFDASSITIQSRSISFIKQGIDIIWLDFNVICGDKRSQLDYLELSKKFTWFIIENIHALTDKDKDIARRFTWLIDVLYDEHNKLALSSDVAIEEIYTNGEYIFEFSRTVSRLKEMKTSEYLSNPKRHVNFHSAIPLHQKNV